MILILLWLSHQSMVDWFGPNPSSQKSLCSQRTSQVPLAKARYSNSQEEREVELCFLGAPRYGLFAKKRDICCCRDPIIGIPVVINILETLQSIICVSGIPKAKRGVMAKIVDNGLSCLIMKFL